MSSLLQPKGCNNSPSTSLRPSPNVIAQATQRHANIQHPT
jgi:hypothetical protein